MTIYELLAKWGVSEEGVELLLSHGVADNVVEVFIDDNELGSCKLEIGLEDDGVTVLGYMAYETNF